MARSIDCIYDRGLVFQLYEAEQKSYQSIFNEKQTGVRRELTKDRRLNQINLRMGVHTLIALHCGFVIFHFMAVKEKESADFDWTFRKS